MDNASSNDVLVRTLAAGLKERYDMDVDVKSLQGRCIAHVVNLVVQKLLHSMNVVPDDPDHLDYFAADIDAPLHYSMEDDLEIMAMETPEAAKADEEAGDAEDDELEDEIDHLLLTGNPVDMVFFIF
jgi:hypothetical protein